MYVLEISEDDCRTWCHISTHWERKDADKMLQNWRTNFAPFSNVKFRVREEAQP